MPLPATFTSLATTRLPDRPVHLAIGMFDGVHLGHQAVIAPAARSARSANGLAGVLTFHPHPSRLFRPQDPVRMIMTVETKTWVLEEKFGLDFVIEEPFTPEFAAITADEFLPSLRRALPHLAAVYVGENWRFGAGRRGDIRTLVGSARPLGVNVFSVPGLKHNGETISSTRIRAHLAAGEIAAASELLGYTYFARGPVVPGRRLGHTLGFPTLNLAWHPECAPTFGVYAAWIRSAGDPHDAGRPAVANYGVRPTVEPTAVPRLETHVLADCPWSAGSEVHIEWRHFLRPEQRFASVDELRAQIGRDRDTARQWLAAEQT